MPTHFGPPPGRSAPVSHFHLRDDVTERVYRKVKVLVLLGGVCLFSGPASAADGFGQDFDKRRLDLISKHDKNKDGRLDPAERDAMRLALKDRRLKKKESGFKIPADFLAKYDSDKDGEMAGEEWRVAWEAETRILREAYDSDKDGSLNDSEKKRMMGDVKDGKITGIPAFFAGRMVNDPSSSSAPPFLAEQERLLKFDGNGDGRASAAELKQIRESGFKK